ncbi:hypothetical protein SLS62_009002 [Diatrype stigma]|uniref:Peptidase metallopeptidase domain-containing protein n=1 Tax=Diatrype stigma TaxID=117547 RepID=A0AAN9UIL9_9PEZI
MDIPFGLDASFDSNTGEVQVDVLSFSGDQVYRALRRRGLGHLPLIMGGTYRLTIVHHRSIVLMHRPCREILVDISFLDTSCLISDMFITYENEVSQALNILSAEEVALMRDATPLRAGVPTVQESLQSPNNHIPLGPGLSNTQGTILSLSGQQPLSILGPEPPIIERRKFCVTEDRIHNMCSICVGRDQEITRWNPGSRLRYWVDIMSFGAPRGRLVQEAMRKAIRMWEGSPVTFEEVDHGKPYNFMVKYKDYQPCEQGSCTFACSFLPGFPPYKLKVFAPSFELDTVPYLANILSHEIGHILGLRHENAIENRYEREKEAIRWGPRNQYSVMNNERDLSTMKPNSMDIKCLQSFYDISDPFLEGKRFWDFEPKIHTNSPGARHGNAAIAHRSG